MITFLHTRIRVSDLDKSIDWYCKYCGFQLKNRTAKSPAGNQIANIEVPGSSHYLELTYSPDFKVEFPEDLMHTCIGVDDLFAYCDKIEKAGADIWPSNWREEFVREGGLMMAFITDPDGYEVEILSNKR